MYGSITKDENRDLKDMTRREYAYLVPIIVFIVWIGVYPKPFLDKMDVSVQHLLEVMGQQRTVMIDAPEHIGLNSNYTISNYEQLAADQRR